MKAALLVLLATVAGCADAALRPLPTVVLLQNDETGARASAVPLSPTWLLTAKHAVPMSRTADGVLIVQTIEHPTLDLALMRVAEPQTWVVAQLATVLPEYGDPLQCIGWHAGKHLVITDGRQAKNCDEGNGMSCPVVWGASGGAVLNRDGQLVGVVSALYMMGGLPIFHLSFYAPVVGLGDWILSATHP